MTVPIAIALGLYERYFGSSKVRAPISVLQRSWPLLPPARNLQGKRCSVTG